MHRKVICCIIFFLEALALPAIPGAYAGVTGALSGYVTDKESGKPIPGVSIRLEDTELQTWTDKYGRFIINNIPAGVYNVITEMRAYAKTRLLDVVINADLTTKINLELELQAFMLKPEPEVIVTAKRYPIRKETTSSTFYIDNAKLTSKYPIDSYLDSFKYLPGIYRNHFRGGRVRDTIFLLDGIPIISGLTRDLSFTVPTSAISEVLVHTGGFSSEYGNASSGIVNIITRRGRNSFSATARSYTDYMGLPSEDDRVRHLEFGFGGPMTVSFGGPPVDMNYYIAAELNQTNTPFEDELREHFKDPIATNINASAVYDIRISRNVNLSFQALYSNWKWRRFEEDYSSDLSALPLHRNRSIRSSFRLTHTLSPSIFYYISASYSRLHNRVSGGEVAGSFDPVIFSQEPTANAALGIAVAPWKQESKEEIFHLDASILKQLTQRFFIKAGITGEYYDVKLLSDRYILQPRYILDQPYTYSRFKNNFRKYPRYLAGNLEVDVDLGRLQLQLGGRIDYLNANTGDLPAYLRNEADTSKAMLPRRGNSLMSPRIGLSAALSRRSQIFMNYGRYVQVPSLYYYYAGSGANSKEAPLFPIFGDPDLKPSYSTSVEVSWRHAIAHLSRVSITGFYRKFSDLINTVPQEQKVGAEFAQSPTKYANEATSESRGIELELNYVEMPGGQFQAIYTYMRVLGTASIAEEGYFQFVNTGVNSKFHKKPLNWDQRHSFILSAKFKPFEGLSATTIARIYGPREWFAPGIVNDQFESVPSHVLLDLQVSYAFNKKPLRLKPFFEVRNLLNHRNREARETIYLIDSQPIQPFEESTGRRFRLGIQIN